MKQNYNRLLFSLVLLLTLVLGARAEDVQVECFEYSADGKTIIGLTEEGRSPLYGTELVIPVNVTSVTANAFAYATNLTTLTILGNPVFDDNALSYVKPTLTSIDAGSGMSSTNIKTMLTSLGSGNNLSTLEIGGYTDLTTTINWTDMTDVLTGDVSVRMPAEIVKDQVFGAAKVYGRFSVRDDRTLATFCGNATFYDGYDEGSNMLFYVPVSYTKGTENQLHIKRVFYIVAGQGVLVHPDYGTSHVAYLPRIDGINAYEALPSNDIANNDKETYNNNMFVGVMEDKMGLPGTEEKGGTEYTNFVLSADAFWPVGDNVNLRANRAYLQIPTANLTTSGGAESMLRVNFDDGTTDITVVPDADDTTSNTNVWYTLDGRRLEGEPTTKGIYINQNRKIVIQ